MSNFLFDTSCTLILNKCIENAFLIFKKVILLIPNCHSLFPKVPLHNALKDILPETHEIHLGFPLFIILAATGLFP